MGPNYRLNLPDDVGFQMGPSALLEGEIVERINAQLPNLVPPDGYKIAWYCEAAESSVPGYTTFKVRAELEPIIRFADDDRDAKGQGVDAAS